MRFSLLYFLVAFLSLSCTRKDAANQETASPEEVLLDKALAYHFENGSDSLQVSFQMRGRDYTASLHNGAFEYTRQYTDTSGAYAATLTNLGLVETRNGAPILYSTKDSISRAGGVNSVIYFSLLPIFLKDEAVNICCMQREVIDGKAYDRLEVRFSQDGGGTDNDDVYLYWIDPLDGSMDFLAYSFQVNERGTRFRKATNPRRVNGVLFQDYINFIGPSDPDSLTYISSAYRENRLDTLSLIELENLSVSYLNP